MHEGFASSRFPSVAVGCPCADWLCRYPIPPCVSRWELVVHVAIGANMDDATEKATHLALTALCSQNLAATAGMPISLYPIQDHSDPEWKACVTPLVSL
jgi:hypothetical protein